MYLYIFTTITISYIYQGFIYLTAPDINSEKFSSLILGLMYFPGLVALLFIWRDRQIKNQLKLKQLLFLLYALAIPLGLTILFLFLVELLGVADQSIVSFVRGQVIFLNEQPTSIISFLSLFLLNFSLGSIFTGIYTIGEELGWRGYLQNKLIKKFGVYRGIILLGIIWGYWHLPIILMGYNYPEYPWLGGLVLMPLTTIGFSGIFAWLTLKGKNIWPAVLAHGAINNLFSNTFMSRIESNNILLVYLLLTFIWFNAGIIAMMAISKTFKQDKMKNLEQASQSKRELI